MVNISKNKHTVTSYTDKNNEILRFTRIQLKSRKQIFASHLNPSTFTLCIQINFSGQCDEKNAGNTMG